MRQNESANNLILSLLGGWASEAPPEVMAYVENSDGVTLVGLKTDSSHPLILSFGETTDAVVTLVDALSQSGLTMRGVFGPREAVRVFSHEWTRRTQTMSTRELQERIYQIERVVRPARFVPGDSRWASAHDLPYLISAVEAFTKEALSHRNIEQNVRRRLEEGCPNAGYLLWEVENHIVSMAGYGGRTGTGVRLAPVYTAPHLRGHGYASAVVMALTDSFLKFGYRRVFLFTDLAKPTSNGIYQDIGYRRVGDVDVYAFRESGWK